MNRIPFKFLNRNERTILGVIDMPEQAIMQKVSKSKICIICNGLNGNRIEANRMLVKLANTLTSQGNMCVRFDYSGLGLSEGNFWESSMETKVNDLIDTIHYIQQKNTDKNIEWILLGYSDGIGVILNVLKMQDISNYRIVAWSPILLPVKSEVKERIRLVREPHTKALVLPFAGLWLGKQYMRDISTNSNLFEEYLKYTNISYTIFGTSDAITEEIQNEIRKIKDIEVDYIEGGDHVFSSEKYMKLVIEKTSKWIGKDN